MEVTNKKTEVIPQTRISKNQHVGMSEHLKVCTNLRFCAENMQFFDWVSREIVNIRLFFLQEGHFGEKIASLHRNS